MRAAAEPQSHLAAPLGPPRGPALLAHQVLTRAGGFPAAPAGARRAHLSQGPALRRLTVSRSLGGESSHQRTHLGRGAGRPSNRARGRLLAQRATEAAAAETCAWKPPLEVCVIGLHPADLLGRTRQCVRSGTGESGGRVSGVCGHRPWKSLRCVSTSRPRSLPQFSSVQSLSDVRLFATPWTTACQASLSVANSWSLLKLMSIGLVMPSISSSIVPFCLQSFPASGSFPMSQLFAERQKIGASASASVLPMNSQD